MNTDIDMHERRRSLWKGPALVTALFLLIPLLGNSVVAGWNWPLGAFVRFGTFIFGLGLTYQLVTRKLDTIAYRVALGVSFVATFLLLWLNFVQMADDVNPAARIYFAVPVIFIIGAVMARFRPNGMSLALFATALAQASVLAIALIIRDPQVTSWTAAVLRGFGGNTFLLLLFVGSALLFRTAARGATPGTA
jgi:hypothetical protein